MTLEPKDFESLKDLKMDKKIGHGTFGDIYSAILIKKGVKVAIKRVNKRKMAKYGTYLEQAFYKELECMQKCSCENSVRYYKKFETENNHNIIMELCDGDLSTELSKRSEGFNTEEVKFIMSQLNNAFKKLNENHIIHRDLKLGNILIKYTDETKKKFIPKLCDYGFSKELNNTNTETHLGTPATMAPEIMKSQKYDSKADLWSVGVILYQLHFKGLPYMGATEETILKKIQNKTPYKEPEDPKLKDLIHKLLVEDPQKRLSWEEYFNHPFFATEENNSSTNTNNTNTNAIKNKRYTFIKDYDIGFKSDLYKCYIALDQKHNKNVLIKSYNKDYIKSHDVYFNTEYELSKAYKGNPNIIQLINVFNDDVDNTKNLVYDYIESEILSSYITHHDFTEEEIQKMNKSLFENIFNFNECNFKSFIFVSIYSFAITKEGKPILFDFGLCRLFLPTDELFSYFIPNKNEIGNTINPTKTNVMNYGITLLKCFFGNNLKIKIDNITFDLPKNKIMSNTFCNFLSQCLYRDINKRSSWYALYNHSFIKEINKDNDNKNINKEGNILIDNNKLKIIFESLEHKFRLINEYYGNLEMDKNTQFIGEIEIFLLLTLFEQLMILEVFDRNEKTKPFTAQQEISFITITDNSNNSSRCNINFANPVLKNMKIFDLSNNILVTEFLSKLKNYIENLKKISLKVHKITKSSLVKGNYHSFLESFIQILESSNFHNYFFSIVKKAHNYYEEKSYDKAYKEIPIAEYICECILFVKASLFESKNDKIYFDNKKLIKQFNEIFDEEKEENKIEISVLKISNYKEKYVLISFLGVLFRFFKNSMDINQCFLQQNKNALDGLLSFYPSLMKLLVDTKKKLE